MPKIKINDINMYYHLRGQGPPLMMIMGWTANMDWWPESLVERLKKQYSLVLFDNRGSGRTDGSKGCYHMGQFAKDAAALMDALDIRKADVFGVSMGGMIAQEMAIRYPDRINRLILGCTTCGSRKGRTISLPSLFYAPLYSLRFPPNIDKWLLSLTLSQYSLDKSKSRDFIRRIKIAPIGRVNKWKQFFAIKRFQSHAELNNIVCPVLLMTGTRDFLVPHRNTDILAALIPQSQIIKFPGASHAFIGDDPDAVFQAIDDFLRPREGSAAGNA